MQSHRVIVIGAGPGGLQLGYFLQRSAEDYVILEAGSGAATFFQQYPRHRTLLSINKIYTGSDDPEVNLRWDWNSLLSDDPQLRMSKFSAEYFPSADDLVRYLQDFAERCSLDVRYDTRVQQIDRGDHGFVVRTDQGTFEAEAVVVATGLSTPWVPDVPGIEHAESYRDVSIDPRDFLDQRVLVIGKGNAAFEIAGGLMATTRLIHLCSPNPVRLAWQTHYVGHLRAVNNDLLDSYQLKSQNAVLDATIERIEAIPGESAPRYRVTVAYQHAHGEREVLEYDRIIACTGWRFDRSIFAEDCRPQTTVNPSSAGKAEGKLPAITSSFESTNIPGLFFCGSLTSARGYKKNTSSFIHGARYNAQALHRVMRHRFHRQPWPSLAVKLDPQALAEVILARVNRSSAMWQQFGFIGDVISLQGDTPRMLLDVPVDLAHDGLPGVPGPYYTVTLEYGAGPLPDPFAVERVHRDDADRADQSQFLHPIVRRFDRSGVAVAEHHVIEDLAAEWREPVHRDPLVRFLEQDLAALRAPTGSSVGAA